VSSLVAETATRPPAGVRAHEDIALIDLLDRLLCGGVVLAGDITLAVADIDLVYIRLRALIASVSELEPGGGWLR